jgi:hypothetical protein
MAVLIHSSRKQRTGPDVRAWATAAVAAVVMVIYALIFKAPLQALWLADRGAVEMAQAELADFPAGEWDDGSNVGALAGPAARFDAVLRIDPNNRTAHYRLGLIAMLARDFLGAIAHLEVAYNRSPEHAGTLNSGLCLCLERAAGRRPGADRQGAGCRPEMRNYAGWWRTQGRDDLAA